MHCTNCGSELGPGDAFCPECGTNLDMQGDPEQSSAGRVSPPAVPPGSFERKRVSVMAVSSMVLGILGYFCLFFVGSILAIVLGAVARSSIRKSEGELSGGGMALAGIILGSVLVGLVFIGATVYFPWAWSNMGPARTVTRSVELKGEVSRVKAGIDIGRGDLRVSGGSQASLMKAEFTTNVKDWEPAVDYSEKDGTGDLAVAQPEGWKPVLWYYRNDWDIRFSEEVPLEIRASTSAADASLDVGRLDIVSLDLDSSTGDIDARLNGSMDSMETVRVDSSAGDLYVVLTGDYEKAVLGDFETTTGDIELDLLGQWEGGLQAEVGSTTGDVALNVPAGSRVRVRVKTGTGEVDPGGMELVDSDEAGYRVYMNTGTGGLAATLEIQVGTTTGDIDISVR